MTNHDETSSHRWRIAAAGLLLQMALGAVYAWSVFRIPLATRFGWTIAEVTLPFTISIFVLGVAAFVGGLWMNRHGPRIVALTGGALSAGRGQHVADRAVVRHRVEGGRDAAEVELALRVGTEHAAQVHVVALLRVVQAVGAALRDVELGARHRLALRFFTVPLTTQGAPSVAFFEIVSPCWNSGACSRWKGPSTVDCVAPAPAL